MNKAIGIRAEQGELAVLSFGEGQPHSIGRMFPQVWPGPAALHRLKRASKPVSGHCAQRHVVASSFLDLRAAADNHACSVGCICPPVGLICWVCGAGTEARWSASCPVLRLAQAMGACSTSQLVSSMLLATQDWPHAGSMTLAGSFARRMHDQHCPTLAAIAPHLERHVAMAWIPDTPQSNPVSLRLGLSDVSAGHGLLLKSRPLSVGANSGR